jgi:hypothetical protein
MLECHISTWSLVLILGQQLRNEVLGFVGDVSPDSVLEGEFTKLDLLHDFLVGSTVEWGNT